MPIYEFKCNKCGEITVRDDISIKDVIKTIKCNKCGGVAKKIISSSTFKLEGSGWYKDGYTDKGSGKKK